MTIALTATLILLTTGFLILLDRKDARAHTRQQQHDEQIERLCQRIQAPEVAVIRHEVDQAADAPQPAAPNDDEGYWKLSDEHQRAIAEIEARENAPFDRV